MTNGSRTACLSNSLVRTDNNITRLTKVYRRVSGGSIAGSGSGSRGDGKSQYNADTSSSESMSQTATYLRDCGRPQPQSVANSAARSRPLVRANSLFLLTRNKSSFYWRCRRNRQRCIGVSDDRKRRLCGVWSNDNASLPADSRRSRKTARRRPLRRSGDESSW